MDNIKDIDDNKTPICVFFDGNTDSFGAEYIRNKFCKRRYLVELGRKDLLAQYGEVLDTCYYITEGILISYEKSGKNRRIYDYFEPGMFVFLEQLLMDPVCRLTYEALTPMKLYSIDMVKVEKLLKNDWVFSAQCLAQMTRNYLVMKDLLRKSAEHSAQWLVCDLLLVFAKKDSYIKDGITHINIKIPKTLLSDMLHLNRITVTRELALLQEKGLCTQERGMIRIMDVNALREYRDTIDI